MSDLTVTLLGREKARSRSVWNDRFAVIGDRLQAQHGVPALGNFHDPVAEIFYIMLSARTTDAQYRKTHAALRRKFPALADLAKASVREIRPCIITGGLAAKRASHVKATAEKLLALGTNPSKRMREMSADEAFAFITNLPGMGPKSAFCVMMYSLGHDTFPVDINVQRIAARLGAIPTDLKHYQAQVKLPRLIPSGRSKALHIGLVVHGRKVCLPRMPKCDNCCISEFCKLGKKRISSHIDHEATED